jgi:hypothetical protein
MFSVLAIILKCFLGCPQHTYRLLVHFAMSLTYNSYLFLSFVATQHNVIENHS